MTQISVNFFKFDLIKDINVITPEENTQMEKIVYFCFENYQILQNEKYKNILIQKYKNTLENNQISKLEFQEQICHEIEYWYWSICDNEI